MGPTAAEGHLPAAPAATPGRRDLSPSRLDANRGASGRTETVTVPPRRFQLTRTGTTTAKPGTEAAGPGTETAGPAIEAA